MSWHVSRNKGNQYLSFLPFLLSDVISVNTVRMGQKLVRKAVMMARKKIHVRNVLIIVHNF